MMAISDCFVTILQEEDGDDLNAETEDVEQEVDERALNRDSTIHTDMELLRLSHQVTVV